MLAGSVVDSEWLHLYPGQGASRSSRTEGWFGSSNRSLSACKALALFDCDPPSRLPSKSRRRPAEISALAQKRHSLRSSAPAVGCIQNQAHCCEPRQGSAAFKLAAPNIRPQALFSGALLERPAGGPRRPQRAMSLGQVWEELVDCICRPPRCAARRRAPLAQLPGYNALALGREARCQPGGRAEICAC